MSFTILIVEDNHINKQLMSDLLTYHGFNVLEAENGEEGIKMAVEKNPDLVIMDMQMPVMDGFEAIKKLRNNPDTESIKILAITSFAMRGDKERIIGAGADFYMPKPIDTREFPKAVDNLIHGRTHLL
jgi:two-component system cell cycle response regulator DivK